MYILPLLFRIVVFAGGLFFLLEYIVVCKISTKIGIALMLVATLLAIILFFGYRLNKLTVCSACNQMQSTGF